FLSARGPTVVAIAAFRWIEYRRPVAAKSLAPSTSPLTGASKDRAIGRGRAGASGGESGIRTHGRLPVAGFQDQCNRPLCHLSCALESVARGRMLAPPDRTDRRVMFPPARLPCNQQHIC